MNLTIERTGKDEGWDLALWQGGQHAEYCKIINMLFPEMLPPQVPNEAVAAYDATGAFMGTVNSIGTGGFRKNPLPYCSDLPFFYACYAQHIISERPLLMSRCRPGNYGSLRMFQKFGYGARIHPSGDILATANPDELQKANLVIWATTAERAYKQYRETVVPPRLELWVDRIMKAIPLIDEAPETDMVYVRVRKDD